MTETIYPEPDHKAPGRDSGSLAFLITAMLFPSVATWLYFIVFAGHPSMRFLYAGLKALQFALPLVPVLVVGGRNPGEGGSGGWSHGGGRGSSPREPSGTVGAERRRNGVGAGSERKGLAAVFRIDRRSIGAGIAFGVVVSLAVLGVYGCLLRSTPILVGPSQAIRTKLVQLGAASPAAFLALALFYSLIHSFLEEYYFRWFVFGRLRALLPTSAAVAVSSLAFMAHHVILLILYFGDHAWLVAVLSGAVAAGGAVWAWLYQRSGSLLGPWVSHLLVDACLMAIGFDMIRS